MGSEMCIRDRWMTYRVQRSWGATNGLCAWFFLISSALSTAWMVLIGIAAVLFLGAELSWVALASSLVVSTAVIVGLFWATLNPGVVSRWARVLPPALRERAVAVISQLGEIRTPPGQFFTTALFSLLNRLCDLGALYLAVCAVVPFPPGVLGDAGVSSAATTVQGICLLYTSPSPRDS